MALHTETVNFTTLSNSRPDYTHINHDDYVELMPTWGYAASAFVLFLIGFFGFFLNLMVIILMFKDKQLWTPLNLILFNLVCSDFSVSVLGNPFTLISALSHRWVFGKTMCVLYGFFMTLLGITSITTLTVLSFERYMMVSRPLVSHHLSMRGASVAVFCIWCYSFAVTTPPLFGWGNFVNEAANISCSVNWEEQTFNTLTYILFLFAMGLVLPVIIIIFSYMNIIRTLKKNAMRMGRVTNAESRVTMMVFIMILTFMMAWTPYSILALIEQFAPHDIISPGLGVVPALVAKSSICYDPIIYVGMNTQFRSSVKRIFGFGDKNGSVHEKGIENTQVSPSKPVSQYHDNNIKLQYLNPGNNTLVAVTIYQDEEYKSVPVTENDRDNKKKNKLDKGKKKVILTDSSTFDESTEMSTDFYINNGKDNHVCDLKHKRNMEREFRQSSNEIQNPPVRKSVTYIIQEDKEVSDFNKTTMHEKPGKLDKLEQGFEDSSSGNANDGFNSDDMLIFGSGDKTDHETKAKKTSFWLDKNVKSPDFFRRGVNEQFFSFENEQSKAPTDNSARARRKSMAYTQDKAQFETDFNRLKCARRKSSSNILSGHTRKLSTALYDTKGAIVTRLMVDEREKSKLMCIEEMKANFHENTPQDEQML